LYVFAHPSFLPFFCPCYGSNPEQTSGLRFVYHHALVDKKNREFKHPKPNPQRYEPTPKPFRTSRSLYLQLWASIRWL